MTTILPPRELAVIRSVAESAAVLFVWMSIERLYPGRPVSDFQFADLLNKDVRTIRRQLRSLSSEGLVMGQGNGWWMLTPEGRNTLFAGLAQNVQVIEGDVKLLDVAVAPHDNSMEQNDLGGEVKSPSTFCAESAQNVLHDDDESIHESIKESSSSINEGTFCANVKQVLQHTSLLFGSSVSINRTIESRDVEYVLCWVSKAWQDRQRLSNPAGLIYKRLMENQVPPVYLRKDPTKGLPSEYLEAIGLLPAIPDEAEPVPDFEEIPEAEEIIDPEKDERAVEIWNMATLQLQTEMPRSSFDTWVRDAQVIGLSDDLLTVRVRNAYARDWLESRLESTVNRMLIGICGEDVHVRFVSAGGE